MLNGKSGNVVNVAIAISVLLGTCVGFLSCGNRDAAGRYRKGLSFFESGDYARAAIEFQNCLQQDPRQIEARFKLARCFVELGQPQSAEPHLRRIVEEQPTHLGARIELIPLQVVAGQSVEALQTIQDALAQDPGNTRPLLLYARGELERGSPAEALNAIWQALSLDPRNLALQTTYGEVCLEISRWMQKPTKEGDLRDTRSVALWQERAENALNKVIAEDPQNIEALLVRSQLLTDRGDLDEADKLLERILEVAPKRPEAWGRRVNSLLLSGKFDLAVQIAKAAISEGRSSPLLEVMLADGLIAQGVQLSTTGNEVRARKLFEEAQSLLAKNRVKGLSLGYALAQLGKFVQAEDVYDNQLNLNLSAPERLRTLFCFGLLCLMEGSRDKAQSIVNEIASKYPGSMELERLSILLKQDDAQGKQLAEKIFAAEGPTLHRLLNSARQLYHLGKKDKSLEMLELARQLAPGSPLPDYIQGTLLSSQPETRADALKAFQQAHQKDPLFPPAIIAMAAQMREDGNLPGAIEKYRQAIQIAPESQSARTGLAITLMAQGELQEAIRLMDSLIGENPSPGFVSGLLGELLKTSQKPGSALEKAQLILAQSPDSVLAHALELSYHRDQARQFRSQNRMTEAQEHYRRAASVLENALRRNPASPVLLQLQSELAMELGEDEKAGEIAQRLLRLKSDFVPAMRVMVETRKRKQDWTGALEICENALAQSPEDPDFLLAKAECLLAQGRHREASAMLRDLLTKDPFNPSVQTLFVRISQGQGQWLQAVSLLESIIALEPQQPQPYLALADLYLKSENFSQAESLLKTAQERFADDLSVAIAAQELLAAKGDRSAAVAGYRNLLKQRPGEPTLISHLARHLLYLDQQEQAAQLISQATSETERARLSIELGALALSQQQPDFAEQMYRLAIENLPSAFQADTGLAQVAAARKDKTSALAWLDSAIEKAPQRAKLQLLLMAGDIAAASWGQSPEQWAKELSSARQFYQKALDLKPEQSSSIHVRLARVLGAQGQFAAEESHLEKAMAQDPENPGILILLSQSKERNGKPEEARALVEQVMTKLSESDEPDRALFSLGRTISEWLASDQQLLANYQARTDDYVAQMLLGLSTLSESYKPTLSARAREDKLQQALAHFQEVRRIQPQNPLGPRLIAATLAVMGRIQEAAETLSGWLQVRPSDHLVRLEYARLLSRLGQYQRALDELESILVQKPDHLSALVSKAIVLSATPLGRTSEAIGVLQNVLQTRPNHSQATVVLMTLLNREGKADQAIRTAEKLLAENPRDYSVTALMGHLYMNQGQRQKAIESFEKAYQLNPNSAEAMNNLAYMYADSGQQLDKALELAQKALDLYPSNPQILDTLGYVYLKRGQTASAIQVFNDVLEKAQDMAATRYHLALAYQQDGSVEQAKRQLELALKHDFPARSEAEALLAKLQKP